MDDLVLDPIEIAASLGVAGGREAHAVEGGSDTRIWRVETPNGRVAVRLFRSRRAALADREAEALTAARAGGIPVPDVIAQGVFDGRPVSVLGWCEGETVLAGLVSAPEAARGLGEAFGRAQAAIHRLSAPARWFAADAPGWASRAPTPLSRASDGPRALLHLDVHPLNVLVRGGTVTAVLDWVNADTGDARADVARTYSILRADPAVREFDQRVVHRFRRSWRAAYEEANGPLREMGTFIAWAGEAMGHDLGTRLSPVDAHRLALWTAAWDRHSRPNLAERRPPPR